jgi:hypothetical protein
MIKGVKKRGIIAASRANRSGSLSGQLLRLARQAILIDKLSP